LSCIHDQASAGQAAFTNESSTGGWLNFYDNRTADPATSINQAQVFSGVWSFDDSTARNGTFINEGSDSYSYRG